jgi:hypothetical protein
MLHNLPLLSNEELLDLLMKESKRFMEALNNKLEYHRLKDIHQNLEGIYKELKRRRSRGEIK